MFKIIIRVGTHKDIFISNRISTINFCMGRNYFILLHKHFLSFSYYVVWKLVIYDAVDLQYCFLYVVNLGARNNSLTSSSS